jgi:hypothetical protein
MKVGRHDEVGSRRRVGRMAMSAQYSKGDVSPILRVGLADLAVSLTLRVWRLAVMADSQPVGLDRYRRYQPAK